MPHSRFFIDTELEKNSEATIAGDELRHFTVMKKQLGDIVEIINGKNQLATAKILDISKKSITLQINEVQTKSPLTPKIILAQSLLIPHKLDLILEKGTELGVDEFIVFTAEHSEMSTISANRAKRFNSILISAIKQCGRLDLPKLTIVDHINNLSEFKYDFIYGEADCKNIIDITKLKISKPICFITGPEKGFSSKEKAFLKNSLKADPITINNNVLRTETAAIAGCAILSLIK